MLNHHNPILLSTPSMHDMAQKIFPLLCGLGQPFSYCGLRNDCGDTEYGYFANGETSVIIPENSRRREIYFLHDLQYPDPNNSLMGMVFVTDALTRGGVEKISLVIPYMTYSRQDKKHRRGVPISAKVVANIIQTNKKIDRIITLDMHADQIQGFYDIPTDNFFGSAVHAPYFRKLFHNNFTNVTIVATDAGGEKRARRFRKRLDPNMPLCVVDKERKDGDVFANEIIGQSKDIVGRDIILYDDICDTGGTVRVAVQLIQTYNPRSICIAATHPIFSNNAEMLFKDLGIQVVVLPTIPRPKEYWEEHKSWLTCVPIEEILAEAIHRAYVGESVTDLFD
ncbi:MAG: ribose-phosphate diphosphokinase [Parcubacteria group bacterium]|nr:ribose-phosphate diphosphokinase [Parcubacteria group bacterium]